MEKGWDLCYVRLVNIFSHKDVSYNFSGKETLLGIGRNYDKTDINDVEHLNEKSFKFRSNGSGKSSFLEGICYGLLGIFIRQGITIKHLIRHGSDHGTIELTLKNKLLEEELFIKREIFKKKSTLLTIKVNEKTPEIPTSTGSKDSVSVSDGNKFILSKIGVSQKDLLNYYFVSKHRYKPFFNSSDTDIINTINRFSNADKIDATYPLIELAIKKIEKGVDSKKTKIESLENNISIYQDDIIRISEKNEDYKDSVADINTRKDQLLLEISILKSENEKKEKIIEELVNKIDQEQQKNNEVDNYLNKYSQKLDDLNNKYADFIKNEESKITELYQEKIEKINKSLDEEKETLSNLKNKKNTIKSKKDTIETNLKDFTYTCPKCDHEFMVDKNIETLKENIKNCNKLISLITQKIEITNQKIEKENKFRLSILDQKNKELEKLIDTKNTLKKEIVDTQNQKQEIIHKKNKLKENVFSFTLSKDNYKNQISTAKSDIQFKKKMIENLDEQSKKVIENSFESEIKIKKEKISETEKNIKNLSKELNKSEKTLQEHNGVLELMKTFKFYLANKQSKIIQSNINNYLKEVGSELSIDIPGIKENSNKQIKESFSPRIYRNGEYSGVYGEFSGGEKATLDFSCICTLRNIINTYSKSGGLNFLFIDEALESIDEVGLYELMKSLKRINEPMILNTHVNVMSYKGKKLIFNKKNGITKLEIENES